MSIGERLAAVQARVEAACRSAGRDPEAVRLIAVSKTRPAAAVQEALAAGQVDFGENYAQELRDKADALADAGARWHFIGHLQRNKVKYVVGRASMIHAVDTLKLGAEISKRAPTPIGVLVEVNVGEEASKSGVLPAEALALCEQLVGLERLELRGLMAIPPADPDPGRWFAVLAELAAEGRRRGLPLAELSMGMSADFEAAIAHGSTMVRVGTAIFGPRQ